MMSARLRSVSVYQFSSVQFSPSVVSDSLWHHESQHARPPCPSSPGVCSNFMSIESVMPSNHLIICHPLLSCFQSFPASESFPVSRPFASGGQSIGPSASVSVLPVNIQGWFPLGLTVLIFLLSRGLSRVFSSTMVRKHQSFGTQPFLLSSSHICTWLLEKS